VVVRPGCLDPSTPPGPHSHLHHDISLPACHAHTVLALFLWDLLLFARHGALFWLGPRTLFHGVALQQHGLDNLHLYLSCLASQCTALNWCVWRAWFARRFFLRVQKLHAIASLPPYHKLPNLPLCRSSLAFNDAATHLRRVAFCNVIQYLDVLFCCSYAAPVYARAETKQPALRTCLLYHAFYTPGKPSHTFRYRPLPTCFNAFFPKRIVLPAAGRDARVVVPNATVAFYGRAATGRCLPIPFWHCSSTICFPTVFDAYSNALLRRCAHFAVFVPST